MMSRVPSWSTTGQLNLTIVSKGVTELKNLASPS